MHFLSSLRLTFYNLLALILWMGAGVVLSRSHEAAFDRMNEMPILDWMGNTMSHSPLPVAWLLVLCMIASILLVNALCCTFSRQLALARKLKKGKPWLFFILHCLFILVLACHGLILVAGDKQGRIYLSPGMSYVFGPYRILAEEVVIGDDPKLLSAPGKTQRSRMTRDNIGLHNNYVRLGLFRNGLAVADKPVYMLSPMRYKTLQVTLVEFSQNPGQLSPGVILTITDSPLNPVFFLVYGIMILALAGFTMLTWHQKPPEKDIS